MVSVCSFCDGGEPYLYNCEVECTCDCHEQDEEQ